MKTEDFDAAELYEEIRTNEDGAGVGQNKLHSSVSDKRRCVQPESCGLSIVGQCELLGLPRSTYYDESATESAENLELKRRIDEQYLQTPILWQPQDDGRALVTAAAAESQPRATADADYGYFLHFPQNKTSLPGVDHRVDPYLLRDLTVDRANQVWCSDNQPKLPADEGG